MAKPTSSKMVALRLDAVGRDAQKLGKLMAKGEVLSAVVCLKEFPLGPHSLWLTSF